MLSDECEDLMSEDLPLENTEDLSCFYPFDRFGGGGIKHLNGRKPSSTDQQAVDMNSLYVWIS